ncbi:uncharacterized protein LOC131072144 isoform X3 [Cryptomeria japonica]|uniref:uncharacterized protein LOC131072144 isoform X3 n=1 Tax=Cryptomeria japonica TaxID=3369 RepID=UPI0027DA44F7|nr:uncharacterized protein LOC131072144 isoform X3 [Cryptomeria japonica]
MTPIMKILNKEAILRPFSASFTTDAKVGGTNFLAKSCHRNRKWDALVIGGGHNGLTAAAYLAKSGLQVAVLERRHLLGGAAVTEELIPGFKFSRGSYLQSLLRPCVIRELDLERHGLKLLARNPSSFTPALDGNYLLLGPDAVLNHTEISKFSKRDAEAYSREFINLLLAPASKVLNEWFESEILKATLATDAVIGAMGSVHTPGSGYVLLHHVMGETNGVRGIWSYVEGGMGAVSNAIAKAASEAGASLVTNVEVRQLMVDEQTKVVSGVLLSDGTQINAPVVLSNATPWVTFMKLTPANVLSEGFLNAVKGLDYSSGTTKINLAVDRLPQFRSCKPCSTEGGPEHRGTIHLGADSMEEIDMAYRDALNGHPSRRPLIEMTIPSVLDKTISPPGKHVINLFIQYTPYKLQSGDWQDPTTRDAFSKQCFNLIDEYAPGFSSSIIGYDMLTPPDLEKTFGLTGGNIFHGAMGLDSLFLLRPVKGCSGYKTPLKGLYLCGAGSHPGGGVMGAPGRNAAKVVLQDKST